jgi:hypothetical protein
VVFDYLLPLCIHQPCETWAWRLLKSLPPRITFAMHDRIEGHLAMELFL